MIARGLCLAISLSACSSIGQGAPLATLLSEVQAEVESGKRARNLTGAKTFAERKVLEEKLSRLTPLAGTPAGELHWAALRIPATLKEIPLWATRISLDVTVLTPEGLAQWESTLQADTGEETATEGDAMLLPEGIVVGLNLSRQLGDSDDRPWRLVDLRLGGQGPRFGLLIQKPPFGQGAALSPEEAKSAAFDSAFLTPAPPFDARALVQSLAGALSAGNEQALFLVAAPRGRAVPDLKDRLSALGRRVREVLAVIGQAPLLLGLPAGTVRVTLDMRGEGKRLEYVIQRKAEGFRITSLKARTTLEKNGEEKVLEIDLEDVISNSEWRPPAAEEE